MTHAYNQHSRSIQHILLFVHWPTPVENRSNLNLTAKEF